MPHTLHRIATIKKGEIQDKKAKDFRILTHTHTCSGREEVELSKTYKSNEQAKVANQQTAAF